VNVNFANLFKGLDLGAVAGDDDDNDDDDDDNDDDEECTAAVWESAEKWDHLTDSDAFVLAVDHLLYNADGTLKAPADVDWENDVYGKVISPPEMWNGEVVFPKGAPSFRIDFASEGYRKFYETTYWLDSVVEATASEENWRAHGYDEGGNWMFMNKFQSVYQLKGKPETAENVTECFFVKFSVETKLQVYLGYYAHDSGLARLLEASGTNSDANPCHLC